jgi:hypothetical protein
MPGFQRSMALVGRDCGPRFRIPQVCRYLTKDELSAGRIEGCDQKAMNYGAALGAPDKLAPMLLCLASLYLISPK